MTSVINSLSLLRLQNLRTSKIWEIWDFLKSKSFKRNFRYECTASLVGLTPNCTTVTIFAGNSAIYFKIFCQSSNRSKKTTIWKVVENLKRSFSTRQPDHCCLRSQLTSLLSFIWDKVFQNGPSKNYGRDSLKKFT